jgi:hypothetical protein
MFCGGENSFCITSGLCITGAMMVNKVQNQTAKKEITTLPVELLDNKFI